MKTKDLLELRKRMKKKKPGFARQDAHKRKEVKKSWRRPKGLQSKMRLAKGGHAKRVKIGFGYPKAVKHLNREGLMMESVSSPNDLKGVNPKIEGIIISGSVGAKKKIEIIKKATEAGIKILNIKKPEEFEKSVQERMKRKKKEKEEKKVEKKKKKEEKPVKKKTIEEEVSEEEKKEREKKERDKILTTQEA